jgi:hypothetical protein
MNATEQANDKCRGESDDWIIHLRLQLNGMTRKIIIGIIVTSALVFVVSMLVPLPVGDSETDNSNNSIKGDVQFLPWQVTPTPEGSIQVFGITLGETTLQQANKIYRGDAEVSLFVSPEGDYKIEAYFDKVVLGGFSSKMILVVDIPNELKMAMFQRGIRVSSLGNGKKKVTLAADDLQAVYTAPVASLTYLTRASLDGDLLVKRFGEPDRRISENEGGTTHWLYPSIGLDIALSEGGRSVLQYVPPNQFANLMSPLLKSESELSQ